MLHRREGDAVPVLHSYVFKLLLALVRVGHLESLRQELSLLRRQALQEPGRQVVELVFLNGFVVVDHGLNLVTRVVLQLASAHD